jgi:hypothetical protein
MGLFHDVATNAQKFNKCNGRPSRFIEAAIARMTHGTGTGSNSSTEGFVMTLHVGVPKMPYLHERYFGRPSCPRCGELLMAPERPEFSECLNGVEIRHFWLCDGCDNQFDTLVRFDAAAA